MARRKGSTGSGPGSWHEERVMEFVLTRKNLPRFEEQKPSYADIPDRIAPEFKSWAHYFQKFTAIFSGMALASNELRLFIEPTHPMSGEGRDLVIKKQLTALGVTKTDQDYGLSLASRTLIDSYNTEQSLFANAGEMAGLEDLQLLDPLTGFMVITDGGRAKNFWLGNQRDMVEIQNQPEEVVKLLLQTKSDHFCIGKNLLMKAVGPMTKRRRNISYDPSGIPTFIVQTQTELEELATEITEACAALPFGVTAYFRGQSSEHLLPDRRGLIEAGVCEYSDVRDHSLIPPLYRHYDAFTNEPGDFREFVSHLLEWNLHGNLALGDPGSYLTIDGKPHTPKSVSREALASRTMNVKGSLQSQMKPVETDRQRHSDAAHHFWFDMCDDGFDAHACGCDAHAARAVVIAALA